MYKLVTASYDNEPDQYLIVDDNYEIHEKTLYFSNWLRSKGYALNTQSGYLRDLTIYLNYIDERDINLEEVTPLHITGYVSFLRGLAVTAPKAEKKDKILKFKGVDENDQRTTREGTTINRMLASVSSFYKCLEVCEMTEKSPFVMLDGVRPNGIYKAFLSYTKNRVKTAKSYHKVKDKYINRSIERLFSDEIETFYQGLVGLRNQLIFDILYGTGMRIGELQSLHVSDYTIGWRGEFGLIHLVDRDETDPSRMLKTGPRDIPVTNELLFKIEEYITEVRPYIEGVEYLFVAESGITKGKALSRSSIEKLFKTCSEKTGIRCHPHLLRHTHCTELKEAGFDLLHIGTRVGHKSMYTTQKYSHPSLVSQAETYMRFEKNREKGRINEC